MCKEIFLDKIVIKKSLLKDRVEGVKWWGPVQRNCVQGSSRTCKRSFVNCIK